MYYVYILQSLSQSITYVGYSKDVARRLSEHNLGKSRATKPYRPLKFVFIEDFSTSLEAKKREKYWKSGAGRRKLKTIL